MSGKTNLMSTTANVVSEKAKVFLTRRLDLCKKKLKRTKRKKKILQVVGVVFVVASVSCSALVASLVFPPLVISGLAVTSAILTGLSVRFNFQGEKNKYSSLAERLNKLELKLDEVVSRNGELTKKEYRECIEEFNLSQWVH